jgi:hypothetical protein
MAAVGALSSPLSGIVCLLVLVALPPAFYHLPAHFAQRPCQMSRRVHV